MKIAARAIVGLVIVVLVGVGVFPGTAAASLGAAPPGSAVPLSEGDELTDEQLLQAEGELWWFVLPVLLSAAAGAATSAIYENWFDEDYGIDRDDRRQIGAEALRGALNGIAGAYGIQLAR